MTCAGLRQFSDNGFEDDDLRLNRFKVGGKRASVSSANFEKNLPLGLGEACAGIIRTFSFLFLSHPGVPPYGLNRPGCATDLPGCKAEAKPEKEVSKRDRRNLSCRSADCNS